MKIILFILISLNLIAEDKLFDSDLGKEPTIITSDKLLFNADDKTFTYSNNVVVTQKDLKITSDKIVGKYKEQNQIDSLIATGNVVITQGPDLKATANKATYDATKETLTLTENPQLEQKGSILNADKIIIYIAENRSEALGTVSAKLVNAE